MREDNLIPTKASIITPPSIPESPKAANSRPRYLLMALIASLFVGGTVFAYYVGYNYQNNRYIPSAYFPTSVPSPTSSISPSNTPTPIVGSGLDLGTISWLKYSRYEPAISVFKTDQETKDCVSYPSFQLTGNFSNGAKLINLTYTEKCGMGEYTILDRLIKTSDNKIYYLANSGSYAYTDTDRYFENIPSVKISIPGLEAPEKLTTKFGILNSASFFMNDIIFFAQIQNPKLADDTEFGSVYAAYQTNSDETTSGKYGMLNRIFYLRHKDDTVDAYTVSADFLSDDRIPRITWEDGSSNTDQFIAAPQDKCGGNSNDILKANSSYVQDLKIVGKSSTEEIIYQFNDPNNQLFKELYDQYLYWGYGPTGVTKVSIDEYFAKHTHILWKDGFNDWHLYLNQNYAPAVECGKPVIYLYPQKDTQVSLKVAANITQSEPQYPETGWTVLAHPNGQLDYKGQSYPNLFWEGTGFGQYPEISGKGFVISQKDLIPTIKSHLKLLGLNSQESSDFLDFWTDKLPKTNYVRLTWLTTNEMNALAPLKVSPQPKSVIRVFLDFEGLDKPLSLTPQTLTSVPRDGFTLVEWGGLLIK